MIEFNENIKFVYSYHISKSIVFSLNIKIVWFLFSSVFSKLLTVKCIFHNKIIFAVEFVFKMLKKTKKEWENEPVTSTNQHKHEGLVFFTSAPSN